MLVLVCRFLEKFKRGPSEKQRVASKSNSRGRGEVMICTLKSVLLMHSKTSAGVLDCAEKQRVRVKKENDDRQQQHDSSLLLQSADWSQIWQLHSVISAGDVVKETTCTQSLLLHCSQQVPKSEYYYHYTDPKETLQVSEKTSWQCPRAASA